MSMLVQNRLNARAWLWLRWRHVDRLQASEGLCMLFYTCYIYCLARIRSVYVHNYITETA